MSKGMLGSGADEQHHAGADVAFLLVDAQPRTAVENDVDLVLRCGACMSLDPAGSR